MLYAVLYNSTLLIFPNNISKTPQHSGRSGVQTDTCMFSYLWVEVHGQSVGDISYLWVEVHGQSVGDISYLWVEVHGQSVGDISYLWVEVHGQSVGGG